MKPQLEIMMDKLMKFLSGLERRYLILGAFVLLALIALMAA